MDAASFFQGDEWAPKVSAYQIGGEEKDKKNKTKEWQEDDFNEEQQNGGTKTNAQHTSLKPSRTTDVSQWELSRQERQKDK